MDTKKCVFFLIGIVFTLTFSRCDCDPDEFGDMLHIQIPVDIGNDRNSFFVGDTLWIEANFPKSIDVVDHENNIELTNYTFFSALDIVEISEADLRYYQTDQVVSEIGEIMTNESGGFNYFLEETNTSYRAKIGILLVTPGKFSTSSYTDVNAQSSFRHPSMFSCKDNLRSRIFIDRLNRYSTTENFQDFNAWNNVEGGSFIQTFEGYITAGKFTFQVIE